MATICLILGLVWDAGSIPEICTTRPYQVISSRPRQEYRAMTDVAIRRCSDVDG